jgi:hypothetical protein
LWIVLSVKLEAHFRIAFFHARWFTKFVVLLCRGKWGAFHLRIRLRARKLCLGETLCRTNASIVNCAKCQAWGTFSHRFFPCEVIHQISGAFMQRKMRCFPPQNKITSAKTLFRRDAVPTKCLETICAKFVSLARRVLASKVLETGRRGKWAVDYTESRWRKCGVFQPHNKSMRWKTYSMGRDCPYCGAKRWSLPDFWTPRQKLCACQKLCQVFCAWGERIIGVRGSRAEMKRKWAKVSL